VLHSIYCPDESISPYTTLYPPPLIHIIMADGQSQSDETPATDVQVDTAAPPQPIGLGIDHGPPTLAKDELPPLPETPADEPEEHVLHRGEPVNGIHPADRPPSPGERSPTPPRISIADEEALDKTPKVGDISPTAPSSPPPPPPKAVPVPQGVSIPVGDQSTSSLQEVELSRGTTPAPAQAPHSPSASPAPRPSTSGLRNASVSSIHSAGARSVQSPSRPTSARPGPSTHRRTSTQTTLSVGSTGHHPGSQLSTVLITPPLQVLVNSKEAKKSASFLAASQKALDLCQAGGDGSNAAYLHPREIFEPLRLAISNPQTTSVPILITSLDLLAKLVSHSFFYEPNGPPKGLSPLPDLIAHTITLSYNESSPPQVALQVVKALMAIVLSTDPGMLVHQSSLLKAIRTVYNVFLLSNDPANQVVAQGGLTQMVHHVFSRVVRPSFRSASGLGRRSTVGENEARRGESGNATPGAPGTPGPENGEKITL